MESESPRGPDSSQRTEAYESHSPASTVEVLPPASVPNIQQLMASMEAQRQAMIQMQQTINELQREKRERMAASSASSSFSSSASPSSSSASSSSAAAEASGQEASLNVSAIPVVASSGPAASGYAHLPILPQFPTAPLTRQAPPPMLSLSAKSAPIRPLAPPSSPPPKNPQAAATQGAAPTKAPVKSIPKGAVDVYGSIARVSRNSGTGTLHGAVGMPRRDEDDEMGADDQQHMQGHFQHAPMPGHQQAPLQVPIQTHPPVHTEHVPAPTRTEQVPAPTRENPYDLSNGSRQRA